MTKLRLMGCCDCTDCAPECQTRAGTATLCGFDEFTDPSTPPRKFRRKTITGEVLACTYDNTDCARDYCTSVTPDTYDAGGTLTKDAFGNQADIRWTVKLVPKVFVPSTWKWRYVVDALKVIRHPMPWETPQTPEELPCSVTIWAASWDGGSVTLHFGESVDLAPCDECTGGMSYYYGVLAVVAGSQRYFHGAAADMTLHGARDVWDIASDHTPNLPGSCTPTTTMGNSARTNYGAHACGRLGNPGQMPASPAAAYGAATTVTPTERRWTLDGCSVNWTDEISTYTSGEVVESLSAEDTPADAIARATAAQPPWTLVQCGTDEASAFISPWGDTGTFGWRDMQTRVAVGSLAKPAIIGHTYDIKVNLYRRPLGQSGEFLFFAQLQASVTADVAPVDWSDWLDVPNEEGWETRVGSCAAVDVTIGSS